MDLAAERFAVNAHLVEYVGGIGKSMVQLEDDVKTIRTIVLHEQTQSVPQEDARTQGSCSAPVMDGPRVNEDRLLEVQSLITRGNMLNEEGQHIQASKLFKLAKGLSKELHSVLLEAQAARGLAAAYAEQPNMLRASGPTYEVAEQLFRVAGVTSDCLECAEKAIAVYLKQDLKVDALRVMERYDRNARMAGQLLQFEERISALKTETLTVLDSL